MSEESNEQTDLPAKNEEVCNSDESTAEQMSDVSAAPADADNAPLTPQSEQEVQQAALDEMASTIEAILFSSGSPVPPAKLSTIAELPVRLLKKAILALNERYQKGGCSFRVMNIAGGYQLMTLPEYNDVLKKLLNVHKESRLSQAALETLAIVAYRQPILRADIESIRGVACGEVLRSLMERQLIKIVGRAEVIGRPMLYGTSRKFLEIFGLGSLEDLPRAEELRQPADKAVKKQEKPEGNQEEKTIDEEKGMKKKFEDDDDEIRNDEFENDEEFEDLDEEEEDENLNDDEDEEDFDDDEDDADEDEDDEFADEEDDEEFEDEGDDDDEDEDFDEEDDEDFDEDDEEEEDEELEDEGDDDDDDDDNDDEEEKD
ncbi:MAG TPA: SMC-Scp complex subunit ScpB [Phycisphaerae bacterium]|nr:SMC-Scp complex subunit ScpB [Phycisphaerae bacterium]